MLAPTATLIASAASYLLILTIALVVIAVVGCLTMLWALRRRGLDRWLRTYLRESSRRRRPRSAGAAERCDVLLCIADHYEPHHGQPTHQQATSRVENWISRYPRLFECFRDSDGKPPRHTFF